MKLFSLPDGTVNRFERASWMTPIFDLAFSLDMTSSECVRMVYNQSVTVAMMYNQTITERMVFTQGIAVPMVYEEC